MAFRIQIDGIWHERDQDISAASATPEAERGDLGPTQKHHERKSGRKGNGKPPPAQLKEGQPDGRFYWIGQNYLWFGSNAKIPRTTRPVMLVFERRGPVSPVCPLTSQKHNNCSNLFFHLDRMDLWFPRHSRGHRDSWLCRNYETVKRDALENKWTGSLPADVLERIRRWLLGEVVP